MAGQFDPGVEVNYTQELKRAEIMVTRAVIDVTREVFGEHVYPGNFKVEKRESFTGEMTKKAMIEISQFTAANRIVVQKGWISAYVEFEYPINWWEHVKRDLLPGWLVQRFMKPVKTALEKRKNEKEIDTVVIYMTCPHIPIERHDRKCVEWATTTFPDRSYVHRSF